MCIYTKSYANVDVMKNKTLNVFDSETCVMLVWMLRYDIFISENFFFIFTLYTTILGNFRFSIFLGDAFY